MRNLLIALLLLAACDPVIAGERPVIPPITERVGWEIEQIPANLTVVYTNKLQVAYPVIASTAMRYEEVFKSQGGLWYFVAPCTSYQKIVRPVPTAYRWGDTQKWQPYTLKTFKGRR